LKRFPRDHFGLVIVDEARHAPAASYRKILNYFCDAKARRGWLPLQWRTIVASKWSRSLMRRSCVAGRGSGNGSKRIVRFWSGANALALSFRNGNRPDAMTAFFC